MPPRSPKKSTVVSTGPLAGVYLLFQDWDLIYVGRSDDCHRRVGSHRTNGRTFNHYEMIPCGSDRAKFVEEALIRSLEPAQNKIRYRREIARTEGPEPKPVPTDPTEHPLMILNKTQAKARVKRFGLASKFEDDWRSGVLEFRPKNPERTQRGAPHIITVGALLEWCEANAASA